MPATQQIEAPSESGEGRLEGGRRGAVRPGVVAVRQRRAGWRCSGEWERLDSRVMYLLGWGGMLKMQVEEFGPSDRGRGEWIS